jgi:hypothetical protein
MKDKFKATSESASNVDASTPNENSQGTSIINAYNSFMAPPIGGIVRCTTCLDSTVQGKVVAYDQQTKMLVLSELKINSWGLSQLVGKRSRLLIPKGTVNPNKPNSYDVSFINVQWCSNLEVIEEPNEPPEMLLNLNISKVRRLASGFLHVWPSFSEMIFQAKQTYTLQHRQQIQRNQFLRRQCIISSAAFIFYDS